MDIAYLSKPNTKLRKSLEDGNMVYSFALPAKSTCPNKGACAKSCYAGNGNYQFKEPREKRERNYALSLSDEFVNVMTAEIQYLSAVYKNLYIRIHDSGDFYSEEYMYKWFEVMKANKGVEFYAYTKMVNMVRNAEDIPFNFRPVYSYGGTEDRLIRDWYVNARVFETEEELIKNGYTNCMENDLLVFETDKVGLVYHGRIKYENSGW